MQNDRRKATAANCSQGGCPNEFLNMEPFSVYVSPGSCQQEGSPGALQDERTKGNPEQRKAQQDKQLHEPSSVRHCRDLWLFRANGKAGGACQLLPVPLTKANPGLK